MLPYDMLLFLIIAYWIQRIEAAIHDQFSNFSDAGEEEFLLKRQSSWRNRDGPLICVPPGVS